LTEAEEEEAWRLLGQGMLETLRKDCEAIVVKGYSPLRRWLRQERARDLDAAMSLPRPGWDGPTIAFGPMLIAADRICAAAKLEEKRGLRIASRSGWRRGGERHEH
jgi:hypothetical protein